VTRRTGSARAICLDASYLQKTVRIFVYVADQGAALLSAGGLQQEQRPVLCRIFSIPLNLLHTATRSSATIRHLHEYRGQHPGSSDIDAGIRNYGKNFSEEFLNSVPDYGSYWPHTKTALFRDDPRERRFSYPWRTSEILLPEGYGPSGMSRPMEEIRKGFYHPRKDLFRSMIP